jgi:hypothetical protein
VKTILVLVSMGMLLCAPGSVVPQQKAAPKSLAQLELTMEVATTSEDGNPSAIRITVRNNGALPVDMPLPEADCVVGGGGVGVQWEWHPQDPEEHTGSISDGVACMADHFPSLQYRVENEWIRLRPAEFISVTQNVRRVFRDQKPGTAEIWAEYVPPEVKPEERIALEQAGYMIPTDKIETEHRSFTIR